MSEAEPGRMPITPEGYRRLQQELEHLEKIERPQVTRQIAQARAYGDLSENTEYHAAKERQAFVEARIRELEQQLLRAQIIAAEPGSAEQVRFGSSVTLQAPGEEQPLVYQIVGPHEADPLAGRIATNSPVGQALLGRSLGEVVEVNAPSGTRRYTILKIG